MAVDRSRTLIVPLLTGLLLSGCVVEDLGSEPFLAFSDASGKLVLVERNPELDAGALTPTPKRVWSLDLASGETSLLLDDVPVFAFDNSIVANERWIVWLEQSRSVLVAYDRELKTRSQILKQAADSPAVGGGALLGLRGDQLFALRPETPDFTGCYDLLVVDLTHETVQVLADAWDYGDFATDGVHVLYADCGPSAAELLSLELRTNLRAADLETGLNEVVRPDARVSGGGGQLLFTVGAKAYWAEYLPGGFRQRLRSYEFATGRLAEPLSDITGLELLAVGDGFAVTRNTADDDYRDLARPARLELRHFNGARTLVAESLAIRQDLDLQVHVIGTELVWYDATVTVQAYRAYNINTGATRTLAPPAR